jgi:DNA processing protein
MNGYLKDMISLISVEGLGPVNAARLLGSVSDPEEIFRMSSAEIRERAPVPGIVIDRIKKARKGDGPEKELSYMSRNGIRGVCLKESDYPAPLRNIYDPPVMLFYKGGFLPFNGRAVAVVGSRRCTSYGMRMAEKLSFDLASRGVTIISGMARGIDTAAHRGALRAGGRTIAVMGNGFGHLYPRGSENMAGEICRHGAVITEYASDVRPSRSSFPRRNRIISGLCEAVIVVEAAKRSGSLITADLALDQGRDVFAVPGPADCFMNEGANRLIQNGARLVMSYRDVMEEMGMDPDGPVKGAEPEAMSGGAGTAGTHRRTDRHGAGPRADTDEEVMRVLSRRGEMHRDEIQRAADGLQAADLCRSLLELEIAGSIETLPGARYRVHGTVKNRRRT